MGRFNQPQTENNIFTFPTADSYLWMENTVFDLRLVESADSNGWLSSQKLTWICTCTGVSTRQPSAVQGSTVIAFPVNSSFIWTFLAARQLETWVSCLDIVTLNTIQKKIVNLRKKNRMDIGQGISSVCYRTHPTSAGCSPYTEHDSCSERWTPVQNPLAAPSYQSKVLAIVWKALRVLLSAFFSPLLPLQPHHLLLCSHLAAATLAFYLLCEHYKHVQFRSLFLGLGHLPQMSAWLTSSLPSGLCSNMS